MYPRDVQTNREKEYPPIEYYEVETSPVAKQSGGMRAWMTVDTLLKPGADS